MRGMVSDIQRFSVHDGPGIRTTVFLKGCNMRCGWCHNPETIRRQPELQVFPDKCIGCGACFAACPQGAHEAADAQRRFHRERCTGCGACARTCYAEALVLVGREMTAEDVVREVLEDQPFYRTSNGGVTISGGEPFFQRDFTMEMLRLCREAGVHTAIETNLDWPWERIAPVLPLVDLVMMDLKVMDGDRHCAWTGVTNTRVLANAQRLAQQEMPLIIRTPVIPGVNDSTEEIAHIAAFIAPFPHLQYYELLPYHPLGAGKYQSLDMPYALADRSRPEKATMHTLAEAARQHGIEVRADGG